MRKISGVILLLLLLINAHAQTILQGQFGVNRLIIEGDIFTGMENTVKLKIPEQVVDIEVKMLTDKDSISFVQPDYCISFKGKIDKQAKTISGSFSFFNKVHELLLKKVGKIKPLYFSQNPVKPFPYIEKELKYKGKKTKLSYGATLTLPKTKGKFPAVILISGTGQQDRNASYSGHKFFAVIADYLTRNGIAVLRVDDRGIGQTNGDFSVSTTRDFADDMLESIRFLKTQKGIDKNHIGLIGHSEGGAIASMVTSESKDIAFMISLSGVGVSGLEILKLQNWNLLKSYGLQANVQENYMNLYSTLFNTVFNTPENLNIKPILEQEFNQWLAKQDTLTLQEMHMVDGRGKMFLYRYIEKAKTNWYRYMIHYKPEDYLQKIKVPVLAINGEKDIMVPAEENIKSIEKCLDLGGNKNYRTKIFPGLNHMCQHCNTCVSNEIPLLDEVCAPEVLVYMVNWIKTITN